MLTLSQITPYLQARTLDAIPDRLKHEYYKETISYKAELAEVFSDEYPRYLDKNRPKERAGDKKYRKSIYKNTWRHLPRRVSEALDYIHQADDFGITFPDLPEGVNEEISLETYTGSKLSPEGDLKEWFFKNGINPYLKDPNACMGMVLNEIPAPNQDFFDKGLFSPRPMLFPSENVVAHQKGRFAALLAPEKVTHQIGENQFFEGRVWHFFDDESYTAAFEVQSTQLETGEARVVWQIIGAQSESYFSPDGELIEFTNLTPILHHCDQMPIYKIGKQRAKVNSSREEFYESILQGVIPKVKEAQQIQNDIELERTLHVTSAEWRRKSAFPKCPNPKCISGIITVRADNGEGLHSSQCPTCKGTGLDPSSGSATEILMVNDSVSEQSFGSNDARPATNGAPGGYIERSIEPIKQLTSDLEKVSSEVYETLNMRFIKAEPNDTSGTSKRYDREELYRELNTQSAHILWFLTKLFLQGDGIRYTKMSYVGQQVPEIMNPVRFNLENAELTREELNDAKDKEYDPALVTILEKKLLEYNVGKKSQEFAQYETRLSLDPFRAMNSDEKNMVMGLTLTFLKPGPKTEALMKEFVFSILLDALMIEAENEIEDFYSLPMRERRIKLKALLEQYFEGVKDIQLEVDPQTGLPKPVQTSIKPPVNVQDINQTDKNKKGFMEK